MKHTLKKLSETSVEVTVTLNEADIATAKRIAVQHLAPSVKVAGFRTGKVPVDIATKHIDPAVLANETAERAINVALNDIAVSQDLRILDQPQVDIKQFSPYDNLEFVATIQILAPIKLGNYKKLKIKHEKIEVSDAEVDEVIERMRSQLAEKTTVDRKAKKGDETNIDFVGMIDGVAFEGGTASGYSLVLGSNNFIPGFEDAIIGRSTGESFAVELSFPDDYHAENLKGKPVTFNVTLNTITELTLPKINDSFAAKVGPFKTVAGMREDVRGELIAQKQKTADEQIKDDLIAQLVAASTIPVPEVLIEDQIRQVEQDARQNLMYRGMSVEQYCAQQGYKDEQEWRTVEFKPAAERRVQAGLVLSELSKVEKIDVTTAELNARLAQMLEQYAHMKDQLDTPEARRDVANRVLTEKTIDHLVSLNS